MDMDAYKAKVWALAAARSGEAVYNGSPEHASIIIERLFSAAESHVRILTGDLEAKVYGAPAVVQAAKQFLGHSDHKLDIVLEQDTLSATHPLVREIGTDANVRFFRAPPDLSDRITFHFMTADEDCFRFEKEKNSHTAVAAFGDGAAAKNLNNIFQTVVEGCDPLDLASRVSRPVALA